MYRPRIDKEYREEEGGEGTLMIDDYKIVSHMIRKVLVQSSKEYRNSMWDCDESFRRVLGWEFIDVIICSSALES